MADDACAVLAACPADTVACDISATGPAALPTVDVLARLALAARRSRRDLRLEHASPAILELLALCGLDAILRGAAEEPGPSRLTSSGGSGGEVVR